MTATIIFSAQRMYSSLTGASDYAAMFVPSEDQLVVLRDLTVNVEEIAQRSRAGTRVPLWREKRGHILVYGFLPPELKELRQSLKVWLAEDYAPRGCSAFFFVFDKWIVHGIKELDDERRETWRSTVLVYPAASMVENLTSATADLLLRYPAKEICVAVEGSLERHEQYKRALQTIDIACAPLATLRPVAGVVPLYRHRDFGVPMILSMGLLLLLFVGMLGYLLLGWVESVRLADRILEIQNQIQSIQINKNLGYIREPQPVLLEMRKPFEQEPSAILDAASRFGRALGELDVVSFDVTSTPIAVDTNNGKIPVTIRFSRIFDKLLVNQENTTRQLLPQVPWVRSVSGMPEGSLLKLMVEVQASSPAGTQIVSASSIFQPTLDAPEAASNSPTSPPGSPTPLVTTLSSTGPVLPPPSLPSPAGKP